MGRILSGVPIRKYLKENSLEHLIRYEQNKKKNGIDLDLYFPTLMDYGDLKAHSDYSKGIQGNDWNTIFGILARPIMSTTFTTLSASMPLTRTASTDTRLPSSGTAHRANPIL